MTAGEPRRDPLTAPVIKVGDSAAMARPVVRPMSATDLDTRARVPTVVARGSSTSWIRRIGCPGNGCHRRPVDVVVAGRIEARLRASDLAHDVLPDLGDPSRRVRSDRAHEAERRRTPATGGLLRRAPDRVRTVRAVLRPLDDELGRNGPAGGRRRPWRRPVPPGVRSAQITRQVATASRCDARKGATAPATASVSCICKR